MNQSVGRLSCAYLAALASANTMPVRSGSQSLAKRNSNRDWETFLL